MIVKNSMIITQKKDFYSHLNVEVLIDANYVHLKRVRKHFKIENLS